MSHRLSLLRENTHTHLKNPIWHSGSFTNTKVCSGVRFYDTEVRFSTFSTQNAVSVEDFLISNIEYKTFYLVRHQNHYWPDTSNTRLIHVFAQPPMPAVFGSFMLCVVWGRTSETSEIIQVAILNFFLLPIWTQDRPKGPNTDLERIFTLLWALFAESEFMLSLSVSPKEGKKVFRLEDFYRMQIPFIPTTSNYNCVTYVFHINIWLSIITSKRSISILIRDMWRTN